MTRSHSLQVLPALWAARPRRWGPRLEAERVRWSRALATSVGLLYNTRHQGLRVG
jgi:hypothetical protein